MGLEEERVEDDTQFSGLGIGGEWYYHSFKWEREEEKGRSNDLKHVEFRIHTLLGNWTMKPRI